MSKTVLPDDIAVAVSTLYESPGTMRYLLGSLADQEHPPGQVVVVLQDLNESRFRRFEDEVHSRDLPYDLVYDVQEGRGLSRGRNRALELSSREVICIADDDCIYPKTAISRLAAIFDRHRDADVVRFRAAARNRTNLKDYRGNESDVYEPRYRDLFRISSIELALRSRVLDEKRVLFDEEFGLGTRYPSGEETLLAVDLWRRGGRFAFVGSTLVVHNDEHGDDKHLSPERVYSKGALFRRLYGRAGLLAALGFMVKKRMESDRSPGLLEGMRAVVRGYRDYGRSGGSATAPTDRGRRC